MLHTTARKGRLIEMLRERNCNGFRSPSGNCQCSERHGLLRCMRRDCGDVFDCHPIEVDEDAIDKEMEE